MRPDSEAWPTGSPFQFSQVMVAPEAAAPSVAPFWPPAGPGNRLKNITDDRLYTAPRSTCHQPEPSHGRFTMFVPFFPSMSITPSTPCDGVYVPKASV